MKIFRVSECDWWMAETATQARDAAIEFYGDDDCVMPLEDIEEVSEANLDRLIFQDEDSGTSRTFREELNNLIAQGIKAPTIFASTEY